MQVRFLSLVVFFFGGLAVAIAPARPATSAVARDSQTTQEAPAPNFDGLWETNFGPMRLAEKDGHVSGHYGSGAASTIVGKRAASGRLEFRYEETQQRGEGWFELNEDGAGFHGKWRVAGARAWNPWAGKRVLPVVGKAWLVVLEAHWEKGLAEEPYSFGEMLENYFRMEPARHVHVRQRYFHDREDFRRQCRDVMFLAEPVVLLVSSHGTDKGILVNGDVIEPEWIAASVAGLSNLRLLHLSGCNMMEGEVAPKILRSLGEDDRFPISGYTTTVAWDMSAVSDFLYMSLVLIRRLDPGLAAAQTRLLAPFTGEGELEGAQVDSLGLKVLSKSSSASQD